MTDVPDVAARIDKLADQLATRGDLTDPSWRDVLHKVVELITGDAVIAAPEGEPFRSGARHGWRDSAALIP